jgi:hypothetical protein
VTIVPRMNGLKARINAVTQAQEDRAFADDIRQWKPLVVAHLDDDTLADKVGVTRRIALSFGITDPRLRARFIMIGIALAPEFWRNMDIHRVLTAPTGTPDIRFGDVCAMFRTALTMTGRPDLIWWS